MDPRARADLQAAIDLDPDFAEPYAVLAFHYALTLGSYQPDLEMDKRESLAREYAQTAIRLNPDLGLAYGALAIIEGAHFRTREEWDDWERALALSPNDPDVLDDAIRSFATKGDLSRAQALAARISDINPEAMLTIQEWLAFSTGNFKPYLDLIPEQIEQVSTADVHEFLIILQVIFESVEGNKEVASRLMDGMNTASIPVTRFFYGYIPYANSLLGNKERAQQQYEAFKAFFGEQSLNNTINGVYLSLAIGDETAALDIMRRLAIVPGPDNGIDTMFWIIYGNFFKDPVLDQPQFMDLRRQFVAKFSAR
jgi:tetratricopeptide (TPR) repeat protein